MTRLTFPIVPDGLLVSALINLAAPALHSTRDQGNTTPIAIRARGMIDSGSTITAVGPRILAALNAVPGLPAETTTAAGSVPVAFYEISFTIYNLSQPRGTDLSRHTWRVTNLVADLDDVDILFGLDLLRQIVLTVDGPAQTFSLDF